jgi:hypothetical protein
VLGYRTCHAAIVLGRETSFYTKFHALGAYDGTELGMSDGNEEGAMLGASDGASDALLSSASPSPEIMNVASPSNVGGNVYDSLGSIHSLGDMLGISDGIELGTALGDRLGISEGTSDGWVEGTSEGTLLRSSCCLRRKQPSDPLQNG